MLSLEQEEKIRRIKKIIRWPIDRVWRKIFPPRYRGYARGVLGLLAAAVVLWSQVPNQNPNLQVYFFDVGQGDGSLIKLGDFEMLIDGGPNAKIVQKLGQVMPFYDREIEVMLLTHPHADHLAGQIEVLRRYKVKRVLYTGVVHTTDEYLAWLEEIKEQGIPMTLAMAGQEFLIFNSEFLNPAPEQVRYGAGKSQIPNPKLEILYPFDDLSGQRVAGKAQEASGLNDTSIVARLTYGQTDFLFMGDAGFEVEKQILDRFPKPTAVGFGNLSAQVLKVGHHGSRFSTSKEFVDAVRPQYAVIQVGKNDYGHPAFRPIWYLEQFSARVLRNDRDGDVVFEDNGTDITVANSR